MYLVYPYKDEPPLYSTEYTQYNKMGLLVTGGYRRLYTMAEARTAYRRLGLYVGGSLAAGGFYFAFN